MLHHIERPIAEHMQQFDKQFRKEARSQVTLLDVVLFYMLRKKGKRLRPMLVLLSAGLYGQISERSYRAAVLIELLHTATLLHDDVIDGAAKRRGIFSVNSVWKNKVSVLAGDFLLSRGLLLALRHKDYDLLHIVTQAVEQMSEGELLQAQKTRKLNMHYEEYMQIIKKKTASLLASCCQVGAASVGAAPVDVEQIGVLGYKLGIAFQMRDDLFDYEENGPSGKPFALDIKQKKITLPLLYALQQCDMLKRRCMLSLLRRRSYSLVARRRIVGFVRSHGGIEYTRNHMESYGNEALSTLNQLPPSPYKESLELLVRFSMQRKK